MSVGRHPNETLAEFAIRRAWETGNFWNPSHPEGLNVTQADLKKLKVTDKVVVDALISMSKMDPVSYTRAVLTHHARAPHFDGEVGPAMSSLLETSRCPVPDYAPPPGVVFAFDDPDIQQVVERMQYKADAALGNGGNWPGCNNRPGIHCGAVQVDLSGISPRVRPLVNAILTNVRKAYAGIGSLLLFIGTDGRDMLTGEPFEGSFQTKLTFVQSSSGWIGLAIVGNGEPCSSEIWLKLLATYLGGSTDEQIINQQFTLWTHELGHNHGLSHSSGGIMNPSIVNNLPVGVWPDSDPSTPKLRRLYGGVPVPIPGGGPPPDPNPTPVPEIERRMAALELNDTIQQVTIDWMIKKQQGLESRIRALEEKTR